MSSGQRRWSLPAGDGQVRAGARLAFGENASVLYRLDRADVVLSLDSHLFFETPGRLRCARDYAERRLVRSGAAGAMPRFYAVESPTTSCFSCTW